MNKIKEIRTSYEYSYKFWKEMKLFISENDDVVNNQIRDVEHSHYKGVLYFQTVIRVHERCVTVI